MILKRYIGQSEIDELARTGVIHGQCLAVRRHESFGDTNKYVFLIEPSEITPNFENIIVSWREYEVTVDIEKDRLIPYKNSYLGDMLDEWLTQSYTLDDIMSIETLTNPIYMRHKTLLPYFDNPQRFTYNFEAGIIT